MIILLLENVLTKIINNYKINTVIILYKTEKKDLFDLIIYCA